jgi:hypothetical protein
MRSMVSSLLEDESRPNDGSDEELIKNCGGVVYSGLCPYRYSLAQKLNFCQLAQIR